MPRPRERVIIILTAFERRITAKTLIMLLVCILSALAQDKPASLHKNANTPKILPVSQYLRQIGIMYLETITDLSKDCSEPHSNACSSALDRWDSTMQGLEDRVNITLSEGRRPAGDAKLWLLLENAKPLEAHVFVGCSYGSVKYELAIRIRRTPRNRTSDCY